MQMQRRGRQKESLEILTMIFFLVFSSFFPLIHATQSAADTNSQLGQQTVLVVPVNFTDLKNSVSLATISNDFAQVDTYIRQASYNQAWLSVTVAPNWFGLNETFSQFSYSVSLSSTPAIAFAALRAASKEFNLTQYQHIVIVHSGYSFTQMRSQDLSYSLALNSTSISQNTIIVSESDTILAIMHEMLHGIGGVIEGPYGSVLRVQDLYDESLAEAGQYDEVYMNNWDIMSSASVGPSAWTELKLGWIPSSEILNVSSPNNELVTISALEVPSQGVKVVKIPISYTNVTFFNGTTIAEENYYLVEFRLPVGIDENLTQSGILITRGSDSRYVEGLPGPVVAVGSLHDASNGTSVFSDSDINLAVVFLWQTGTNATLLFTNTGDLSDLLLATSVIRNATVLFNQQNRSLSDWIDFGPSLASASSDISGALKLLSQGNTTATIQMANGALSILTTRQSVRIETYVVSPILYDAVVAVALFAISLHRRRKDPRIALVYVFEGRGVTFLVMLCAVLGLSTGILQYGGVSSVIFGITYGLNSYIASGWISLLEGVVIWSLGLMVLYFLIHASRREVPLDEESESGDESSSDVSQTLSA